MSTAFDGTGARRITALTVLHDLYPKWAPDIAPRTVKRYRHELARWKRLTGDPPLGDISTETYQRFRNASADIGHAAASTESTLRIVRQMMRCALAYGVIRMLPDRGRPRRIPSPEPHPPSIEEVDAFIRHCHVARWPRLHVSPPTFWRAWAAVEIWTGLRRNDALWGLRWDHVRYQESAIHFRASKTGKSHAFPLVEPIVRQLRNLKPPYGTEGIALVFGPSRSPHLVTREVAAICEAAHIRRLTPKCLRQYAVTSWTMVDARAGELIHGVGIPRVLSHYLDRLAILRSVCEDIPLPSSLLTGPERRQGELF